MGMIECTSGASLWRGYDYYKENKVENLIETSPGIFIADVKGTSDEPYVVEIDIAHPRKSKCNCPHADGKRIVCKHMMAVYFMAFPDEAERYKRQLEEYEAEEEQREQEFEELCDRVIERVHSMPKNDLKQVLLQLLFEGPEWQFERFVAEWL